MKKFKRYQIIEGTVHGGFVVKLNELVDDGWVLSQPVIMKMNTHEYSAVLEKRFIVKETS